MKKVYSESTLEKCLKMASEELNIPVQELKYRILEEKKSFFRKKAIIEIDIIEEEISKEENKVYVEDKSEEKDLEIDGNDGTVKIIGGDIIVKNPQEGGMPAVILVGSNVKVVIDGKELKGKSEVFEENKIEVSFEETVASRELKITLEENHMEAYAEIIYKPQYVYKLNDKKESSSIVLEPEVAKEVNPPKYSVEELKRELNNNNVVYGIIEENLKKCVENGGKILVSKGQPVVNGQNDTIEIKFKTDDSTKKLKEDKSGNIDFKSIGSVEAVREGDTIAVKHLGDEGQDGYDITGKKKVHKPGKKLRLKSGDGCKVIGDNTVVATKYGKPCMKSNTFYVYQVHEVRSDVDLKTGNIKFIGDVVVYGSVKEGMEIECGNNLDIEKDIERANIKAKGNINIKGNVIAAKVFGGGEDVGTLKTLKDLKSLKDLIVDLIKAIGEIKKFDLLGKDKKDGEIIKVLIENKYKILPKLSISVITDLKLQDDSCNIEESGNLIDLIRSKLLGIGPISIHHYSELDLIVHSVDELIIALKTHLSLPVNVKVSYCQDSCIQSSGDIIITGRGEYISDINANGSIYFMKEKSVARGGVLRAREEIKCRVVGSTAGVATRLQVEKEGHIWVDTAYQNTVFVVGSKEFILEVPSKNIHAYLDDKDDIIVDRLKL